MGYSSCAFNPALVSDAESKATAALSLASATSDAASKAGTAAAAASDAASHALTNFATTSETIAGSITTKAVNPADDAAALAASVAHPSKTFCVDKYRTDTYVETGTVEHPFKTIMAAVNQVIANGNNAWLTPYVIKIANGKYLENLILENAALYNLSFLGDGYRQVIIEPASGNALQSTTSNDNLAWLQFQNIEFAKAVDLTGASTNTWLGYNLFFDDCLFSSGNVTFKNLSYPSTRGKTRFLGAGTVKLSNVTQAGFGSDFEITSAVTTLTIETDQTGGVKTPQGWTTGTKVIFTGGATAKDITWSMVNITTWTGTAVQVRACRWGTSGNTIPANVQFLAYNSVLLGNYVVAASGTLTMYNSVVSGTITNSGTWTIYNPASQIKNDSTVTGTTVKDALETLKTSIGTDIASTPGTGQYQITSMYLDAAKQIIVKYDNVAKP